LHNEGVAEGSEVEGVGALLLTGGSSRRMGAPKALLSVDGTSLAQRTAALLAQVAAPVVEVGPGFTDLPAVADRQPGAGPLVALAEGWRSFPRPAAPALLVVACDLPRLTVAVLQRLAAEPGNVAIVPEVDGRLQPLCARYPASALDLAVRLAADGARSLQQLLAIIEFRVWPAARSRRA
jgi:molybdopterin-guanine dinucleotide biosynthesis protein A